MTEDEALIKKYPILFFFSYDHLPEKLQRISMEFRKVAYDVARNLIYCAETSTALRKLLEAKDCAVRAGIASE